MNFARFLPPAHGRILCLSLFACAVSASCALSAQPANSKGGPHHPPAEALEACKTFSSGQACRFTSPQGSVKGSCWAPEGMPLACKPTDAPVRSGQPVPVMSH